MNKLDIPPAWLVLCLAATWGLARLVPALTIEFAGQGTVALIFLLAGLALAVLAAREMRQASTPIQPRTEPTALVTSGIFRRSRNPMYLSLLLFLAAAIIWIGSVLALPLLWLLFRVFSQRFIAQEEAKLREAFGQDFDDWANQTGRWI
ncbi:MAG: methyltransferase family protein [Paracoccaceae bacterium]